MHQGWPFGGVGQAGSGGRQPRVPHSLSHALLLRGEPLHRSDPRTLPSFCAGPYRPRRRPGTRQGRLFCPGSAQHPSEVSLEGFWPLFPAMRAGRENGGGEEVTRAGTHRHQGAMEGAGWSPSSRPGWGRSRGSRRDSWRAAAGAQMGVRATGERLGGGAGFKSDSPRASSVAVAGDLPSDLGALGGLPARWDPDSEPLQRVRASQAARAPRTCRWCRVQHCLPETPDPSQHPGDPPPQSPPLEAQRAPHRCASLCLSLRSRQPPAGGTGPETTFPLL